MRPQREKPLERLVDAEPVWVAGSMKGPERHGTGIIFNCPIHDEYCIVTLTLSPSIRRLGGPDGCEWHGFIRAGQFITCGDSR